MQLAHYVALLHHSQVELAEALHQVSSEHRDEPDVFHECRLMADQCEDHAEKLKPFVERYGEDVNDEPERLHSDLFAGTRTGPLGLLRDLHDLYLMVCECDISWTLIGQAAQGARDTELVAVVQRCDGETSIQLLWLKTRMKQAAPQTLVVAS